MPAAPWKHRTLLIDNFDSFTWNLAHLLESIGDDPIVLRANDPLLSELAHHHPRRLLISPGPGSPKTSPEAIDAIKRCMPEVPILGVCLGHQCIGEIFQSPTIRLPYPIHGKTSEVHHHGKGLFAHIPNPFTVMRYHSLTVQNPETQSDLSKTAWCSESQTDIVMGIQHKTLPIAGLQFHPESFLTEHGTQILENFLSWK